MASLQENLELLKSISANPKKQLDNYIAAGKKVVGCFPVYTPEIMVHAAGMVPMGLWGAQTEISSARNYLPPFACPIMQSCLELGLNGIYEGISCVMIPAMCDTFRCITTGLEKRCYFYSMYSHSHFLRTVSWKNQLHSLWMN